VHWHKTFSSNPYGQNAAGNYATSTPAADEFGVVVTWTSPAGIVMLALDPEGHQMWRRELGDYIGLNGSGTSPIIVDDVVILTNDQDDGVLLSRLSGNENPDAPMGTSSILALDRNRGVNRWELSREAALAAYSTPCLHTRHDGRRELILTSTAHGITGVDLTSGQVNWEVRDIFTDRCVGSPVMAGELVIATYGHGTKGDICVAARAGLSGIGDESTLAYEITKGVPLVPPPLVVNGLLFCIPVVGRWRGDLLECRQWRIALAAASRW